MDNKMKLEFDSMSVNESLARSAVAAFALQLDPTIEEICDIKTALSEAVTNAIIHGYENKIGTVTVKCGILGRTLHISVIDNGCGIADIKQAMEPLYSAHPEMERSGLGFTVMETFMDKIEVISETGKGTTVHMTKTIAEK